MSNPNQINHPFRRGTLRLIAFGTALATLLSVRMVSGDDVVTEDAVTPPAVEIIIPPMPELPAQVATEPVALAQAEDTTVGDGWTMRIVARSEGTVTVDDAMSQKIAAYKAAYDAIPYRRAEYLANPSYRHDAAVEFAFGEMRQTVIHRTDSPERIVNQRPSMYQPDMFPYIGDYRKYYWQQGLYTLRYYPNPIYPTIMVRN